MEDERANVERFNRTIQVFDVTPSDSPVSPIRSSYLLLLREDPIPGGVIIAEQFRGDICVELPQWTEYRLTLMSTVD
jgi:hypothetical protein